MGSGFHLLHRKHCFLILLRVCNVGKLFIINDRIHIAMTNKLHRITLAHIILENSFLSEPSLVVCGLLLLPAVSTLPEC